MTQWPLAVHFALVLAIAGSMLLVSWLLGERHRERATEDPYESGVPSTGTARVRLSARFYLVALLFVIFDVEAAFLFAWAVSAVELGWAGYAGFLVFTVLLVAGLVYEWRQGALDWGPRPDRSRRGAALRPAVRGPGPAGGPAQPAGAHSRPGAPRPALAGERALSGQTIMERGA